MHDFDMVVVGAGGGPSETNLSAYFVKTSTSRWDEGLLALEAGSGLGALRQILSKDPTVFNDPPIKDYAPAKSNGHCVPSVPNGVHPEGICINRSQPGLESSSDSPAYQANRIYSFIRTFIVTHAHLDHTSGLVLGAGSQAGPTRHIVALDNTIRDLEGVFNGRIWPRLAARQGELAPDFFYRYKPLQPKCDYLRVAPDISVRVMPVSHGPCTHSRDGSYESSAWFVRNDRSLREFLFFGDVEPDSLSINARTRHVWKAAAPKIAQGTLSTIFLECSWRSTRAAKELYGHLSPPYVIEELRSLAMEVVNLRKPPKVRPNKFNFLSLFSSAFGPAPLVLPSEDLVGALKGVKLVIIHCKTSTESFPDGQTIEDIILSEVQALAVKERLGVSISVVKQGDKLEL